MRDGWRRHSSRASNAHNGYERDRARDDATSGRREQGPAPAFAVGERATNNKETTDGLLPDANIHETSFKLSRKTAPFKSYDDSLILPKEMKRRSHLFAVPLPQPVPADPVMAPIDDVQLYPCTMAVIFRPHPHAPSPTVRAHARRTAAYSNQHVGVLDTKTTPLLFLSCVVVFPSCCCCVATVLDRTALFHDLPVSIWINSETELPFSKYTSNILYNNTTQVKYSAFDGSCTDAVCDESKQTPKSSRSSSRPVKRRANAERQVDTARSAASL